MAEGSNVILKEPVRMCVICRRRFVKSALSRHTLGKAGEWRSDPDYILPGRGWYCCVNPGCVSKFETWHPGKRRKVVGG